MAKNNIRKINCENKREMEKKNMKQFIGKIEDNMKYDWTNAIRKIENSKIETKRRMDDTLKAFLEINGFKTPNFEDKDFKGLIHAMCTTSLVEDWLDYSIFKISNNDISGVLEQVKNITDIFDLVMIADKETVNNFNRKATETEKQHLFIMCLTFILFLIERDGSEGLSFLLKLATESDNEIERERLRCLAKMIIMPELVAA